MTVAAGLAPRAVSTPVVLRRRPALTLVQVGVTAAPRAPFIAVVVSLLVAGLLGLLVLNTVLAKDAFRLHTLQIEARQLADTEQVLIREVEALRAPSALAAKATEMGMVQAGPPTFLQLSDGAVLGSAEPALAPETDAETAAEVVPAPGPAPAVTEPEAVVTDDTDPEDG
jgi:hypothetical protein